MKSANQPCHPCHLDVIRNEERSTTEIAHKKRQRQQRVGHELARKRMLQHAMEKRTSVTTTNEDAAYPTAVLSHHRPGNGDLFLTGDSAQYSNCAFLDGHEVILAANLHGDVDVLRLPRYNAEKNDKTNSNNTDATTCITELAGRLRLSDSESSYSVTSKYKLKSLQNGQGFAIGTPSGRLSIFATEHGATWCNDSIPQDFQRRVRQENLARNNNHNNNHHNRSREWLPYITRGWEMDASGQASGLLQPESPNDCCWWLKPHGDALWDFRETPSSLLAVHAPCDFSGHSRQLRFMDSRTPSDIQFVDTLKRNSGKRRHQVEGITATCFASDVSIVTASARPFGNRDINNVIQTWDLRKLETPFAETAVSDPSLRRDSKACRTYFISYLTPTSAGNGQVMATSASQENHTTVQHFWFDLGRQQILGEGGNTCIHQPNRNTSVFATNPTQDFIACYDSTPNGNSLRLYNLQRLDSGVLQAAPPPSNETNDKEAKTKVTIPSKRKLNQDDLTGRNLSSSKVSRRPREDDTSSTSSTGDSSEEEEEEEPVQYPGMIPCMGQFKPRLWDYHGLSTTLSCLAVNDTGTAIIGGSFDGDIFAWRGV